MCAFFVCDVILEIICNITVNIYTCADDTLTFQSIAACMRCVNVLFLERHRDVWQTTDLFPSCIKQDHFQNHFDTNTCGLCTHTHTHTRNKQTTRAQSILLVTKRVCAILFNQTESTIQTQANQLAFFLFLKPKTQHSATKDEPVQQPTQQQQGYSGH